MTVFAIVVIILVVIGISAPMIAMQNKKKLKEMDKLIADYLDLPEARRQVEREALRRELVKIKSSISSVDKGAVEQARDKLALI